MSQSHHFAIDFDCSWWAFWTLVQYWVGSLYSSLKLFNCWRKLCKVCFIIRVHSIHNCTFIWKVNFKNLNCCIPWTTLAILTKLAGHVARIHMYKVRQLISRHCYLGPDDWYRGYEQGRSRQPTLARDWSVVGAVRDTNLSMILTLYACFWVKAQSAEKISYEGRSKSS